MDWEPLDPWMDWETMLLVNESTPVNPTSHLALGSVLVVIEKFKAEFRWRWLSPAWYDQGMRPTTCGTRVRSIRAV